jgi:hypothetical protein
MGPVCWGTCQGQTPYKCAAGCSSSKNACQRTVYFQLAATFQFSLNVAILAASAAAIVVTGGAAAPAIIAADEAMIGGMAAAEGGLAVGGGLAAGEGMAAAGGVAAGEGMAAAGGVAAGEGMAAAGGVAAGEGMAAGEVAASGAVMTGADAGGAAVSEGTQAGGFASTGGQLKKNLLAKSGLEVGALAAAKEALGQHIASTSDLPETLIAQAVNETATHADQGTQIDWSRMDISGVSAMIKAFHQPDCDD